MWVCVLWPTSISITFYFPFAWRSWRSFGLWRRTPQSWGGIDAATGTGLSVGKVGELHIVRDVMSAMQPCHILRRIASCRNYFLDRRQGIFLDLGRWFRRITGLQLFGEGQTATTTTTTTTTYYYDILGSGSRSDILLGWMDRWMSGWVDGQTASELAVEEADWLFFCHSVFRGQWCCLWKAFLQSMDPGTHTQTHDEHDDTITTTTTTTTTTITHGPAQTCIVLFARYYKKSRKYKK